MPVQPKRLTQQTLEAISANGSPHFSAHAHSKPRNFLRALGALQPPEQKIVRDGLLPLRDDIGELVSVRQAAIAAELLVRQSGISFQRPFWRRRANVLRPPGVLIRARNPIVRARLRLLGRYVGNIMIHYIFLRLSMSNGADVIGRSRCACRRLIFMTRPQFSTS